ncbi:MAG: hypothetical protein K1X64_17015 [Myxococcaceae bacterium]|nr:hypothetical protein [Myxococcaceae bacterium]
MNFDAHNELFIVQRRELAELFGFETRNKYALLDVQGTEVGYAAEQGKGLLAVLARYFLGHWRVFDIHLFDTQRQPLFRAHHPFRFFFQRVELFDAHGTYLGALQQRWAFFSKRFDVLDADNRLVMEMRSGFFKVWTFPFFRGGAEVARVEKKWGGLLREALTDSDKFRVAFTPAVQGRERALIVAASLFIDLQYFEKQANS